MTYLGRWARTIGLVITAVMPLLVAANDVRLFVRYHPGQKSAAQQELGRAGAVTHHQFDDLRAVAVTLPESARAGLERNPAVEFVEEDPVREFLAQSVPYGITMVGAPAAVGAGATGAGIKVGVVDSGVLRTHEDLAAVSITGEPDFGANDDRTWYRDFNSHGTHVVGTIAAASNSVGVVGVSPGAVAIHMVKVFGEKGNWVYSSDLLAACRAAAGKGCRIISMSLGGSTSSTTEQQGLNDLYQTQGILLIAAAGNAGSTAYSYPASYASVVSVAAIDAGKALATFSQRNDQVELAAPGVSVLSTVSIAENVSATAPSGTYSGAHIENAARGTVTAPLVYGGLGTATNPAWKGKVVLLDRGTNSFFQKVRNVQQSRGVACIIANNVSGNFFGTLGDGNSSTIPAISVSQEDGQLLRAAAGSSVTVRSLVEFSATAYDYFDGTSMATPHVSGVAALIWSAHPAATNAQVRQALTASAEDLGDPGRDGSFGFGLVRADLALPALAGIVADGGGNNGGGNNGGGGDTTAPVISSVASKVTNAKNGSFQISWLTDEPATSDVQIGSTIYADATLVTSHVRSFRGSKGATYVYYVISTDAAGNRAQAGPFTLTLP